MEHKEMRLSEAFQVQLRVTLSSGSYGFRFEVPAAQKRMLTCGS